MHLYFFVFCGSSFLFRKNSQSLHMGHSIESPFSGPICHCSSWSFSIGLLGLVLWHVSRDNPQLLFLYKCFSQHKQLPKSYSKLSQLWSSFLSPNHTSMILYNYRSNLICMSRIHIEWTHFPTLHYSSVLIMQLYTLEFLYSVVLNLEFSFCHVWYFFPLLYSLNVLLHLISGNYSLRSWHAFLYFSVFFSIFSYLQWNTLRRF